MKRSEMIDLMVKSAKDHMYREDAEAAIAAMEAAGILILPPESWRPHDWNERGITYSQWLQEPSRIRVWEPE